ncbi:MAG: 3-dehydroquinate synthase [Pirellulaceae bacterium]|nr:3-dehydroquinate synthase [Pirellulaceae bacterium]
MVFDSDPSSVATVNVPLGDRSYNIQIRTGATDEFADCICDALGDLSHIVVIADAAVRDQWAQPLTQSLCNRDNIRVDTLSVPSGEKSKSVSQLESLWNTLLDTGADRRSVVMAVGGGVIGDLAGFVAASFTRGIRFVQVPTTLLAMVDSSVGGKTGINLPGAKNMVGAFWQPSLVWIDTDVLSSLPDRSYISGLAEVVKYGVIDDAEFFDFLESNAQRLVDRDNDAMRNAIARSCQSKASVVGADERETSGRRAILNYGHTFAHAIEATAGYGSLLHGEAVSIGMQMAARLAIELSMCDEELLSRQTTLLQACRLPTTFPDADPEAMLPVMKRDKKVAHGKLRFILPSKIGAVELVGDVDEAAVVRAIEASR